ncbi:MAG: thiamine pyrophosphate-binding protein [Ruminococcaceae bacterium]|nr:thiamine pyrophosphate-binding protein [Oscillospiraceae bacterium]
MKQRVADYIADYLVAHGIHDVFTVTGGGAMHLNDALGHHDKLHSVYYHHEQAAAMAAEAFARIDGRIAAVCVTTGPGATNAITGVVGGWMDSIPMLVISGQARYATTIHTSGLSLRTRGIQEFDIISSVSNMTKYCELVTRPEDIRRCLDRALWEATHGRPGPCWLDIPLDVQGAMIDPDQLLGERFSEAKDSFSPEDIDLVIEKLQEAQRPILFVGNGVRLSGGHQLLLQLVEQLNIPVVTGMSSIDAIADNHRLYAGRSGSTGDRAGNFAIQNSDVLLSLGSRLSFFQTGFDYKTWARCAYKMVNDIDPAEIEKDSIGADLKLCGDVKNLIKGIMAHPSLPLKEKQEWTQRCRSWRERYPVVQKKHYQDSLPNIYAFFHEMTKRLSSEDTLVVSVGTSRVVGSQASVIHEGMRFITNPSTASMGYCLPAAIGTAVAVQGKRVVLVTGDGSLQMNIQELQTIVHHGYPIAIFIMNNQGYHSIRMTQTAYFGKPLVGVGPESGDLSFPDLKKVANAYGIPFCRCEQMSDLIHGIEWALAQNGPCICEMMLSTQQTTEPKAASKKLSNGQMVSAPLEDMKPFLPTQELQENMMIPLVEGYNQ